MLKSSKLYIRFLLSLPLSLARCYSFHCFSTRVFSHNFSTDDALQRKLHGKYSLSQNESRLQFNFHKRRRESAFIKNFSFIVLGFAKKNFYLLSVLNETLIVFV